MRCTYFKNLFFLAGCIYLILSCSPKAGTTASAPAADVLTPTAKDLINGRVRYPDLSLVQLNEGYNVLQTKCERCHKMYRPDQFSDAEWSEILPKMARKASLSADELNNLHRYITVKKIGS